MGPSDVLIPRIYAAGVPRRNYRRVGRRRVPKIIDHPGIHRQRPGRRARSSSSAGRGLRSQRRHSQGESGVPAIFLTAVEGGRPRIRFQQSQREYDKL